MWGNIKELLQDRRFWIFVVIGLATTVLGNIILTLFVEKAGVNPYVAKIFQQLILIQVNFVANAIITWRGNGITWNRWAKFHVAKAAIAFGNEGIFAILFWQAGFFFGWMPTWVPLNPYQRADIVATGCIIIPSYLLNKLWVFNKKK